MVFGTPRPTQQLNIHCSRCGDTTVRFESWVAEGQIFEMVGNKLSEMFSFLSASPDIVLCSKCTADVAAEAEDRRQQQRNRIRQQMEIAPTTSGPLPSTEPATYLSESSTAKGSRSDTRKARDAEYSRSLPNRSTTHREKFYASKYVFPALMI
jgi:uncharacterized Zn finger protein (UPF0148 family)